MSLKIILWVVAFNISFTSFGAAMGSELCRTGANHWVCEGYCFLGGDTPTNPFQPVSSSGATEQEARDNIDCGPYTETGIVCRQVESREVSSRYTTYCYISKGEAIGMFCANGIEGVVAAEGTITQYDRDGYVVAQDSTKVSKSVANSCQEAMTATADDKAVGCSFAVVESSRQ